MKKFKSFLYAMAMLTLPCVALTSCSDDKDDDPIPDPSEQYAYVDLGLPSGLLWAEYNVGAEAAEEYGNYYAWGETETKTEYTFKNYKYTDEDGNIMDIGNDISGTEYDVARVLWGGEWRMPTGVEVQELIDNCTWVRDSQNGVEGYIVTGPNGNSIFFPYAGYYMNGSEINYEGENGSYWSATAKATSETDAYYLVMGSRVRYDYTWKICGQTVRPVRNK